jgi:diaminopimelate epimerase
MHTTVLDTDHKKIKPHTLVFCKYQGFHNDFILVDETWQSLYGEHLLAWCMEHATRLCERHAGIGADGILLFAYEKNAIKLHVINADKSLASNCGNGLRCVAQYHFSRHPTASEVTIAIGERTFDCRRLAHPRVAVNMGACQVWQLADWSVPSLPVSMLAFDAHVGNPHRVFLAENAPRHPEELLAHIVREHPPIDANIGLSFRQGDQFISYVFERGAGLTQSCASGAVAAAAAWDLLAPRHEFYAMKQPGGTVEVTLQAIAREPLQALFQATQAGSAVQVFTGEI